MQASNYDDRRYYTEAEKDSDEYLMGHIDAAINELVTEKRHLKTAYNYYNGVMDVEEFRYIEDNYGIGNPTSMEFIPLVRKHIDALVGEHLGNKLKPKITCKDKSTLDAIEKMKEEELKKVELNKLKNQFQANLDFIIEQRTNPNAKPPIDSASEDALVKTKDDASNNFISEFEKACQFILEDAKVNKSMDLIEKRKNLMLSLLITGECVYKVELVHEGQAPKISVIDVRNFFEERSRISNYKKKSPRAVNRIWMTREQVLSRYGHLLENPTKDVEKLFSSYMEYSNYGDAGAQYISAPDNIGIQAGLSISVDSTFDGGGYNTSYAYGNAYGYGARWNLIPVYEVEWIAVNKIEVNGKTIFKEDRYKGTRIGQEIYAEMGLDETAIRSSSNPYECSLSFNGISYSDGNGRPYSLVLATKNIQDKYNVLHFHRDNLIALSGVRGSNIDIANVPSFLGENPLERLTKAIAYLKTGINIIDSAQERAGNTAPNTIFSGFDNTVPGQAIQAIQYVIDQTEAVCSSITGVFRERLGNIEQKDAVTNVEVGIKTSAVITKQYFQVMDSITNELLIDLVNMSKVSYKEGTIGSIMLGSNKQKIFTINPKYFCFTDYDINIGDGAEIAREMQEIKSTAVALIESGAADMSMIADILMTESLTDMRDTVNKAVSKREEKTDIQGQLQQQLAQLQEQLKQVTQQAQQLQTENETLKKSDRDISQDKINKDYEVKKSVADSTSNFNNQKLELDKKRVELEKLQLFDDNKKNDEIKNV